MTSLHEDFLSGEEFVSAPNDSEVPKDPQMTYQTRSASSHAETPAAMSPEPTEAPFIPKVEKSSSTARPSVTQPPTVPQSSTSQPPTASPSHMELSPEPNVSVSSNEASFGTNSSAGVGTNESW